MFDAIQWWAVGAGTVALMFLGYLWYSKGVFGNAWMTLIGKQEADLKAGAGKAMGFMLILSAVQVFTFAYLFDSLGYEYTINNGLSLAAWFSVGLLLPVMASSVLFEQRSSKLFWINWGYQLVGMLAVGLIISSWPV